MPIQLNLPDPLSDDRGCPKSAENGDGLKLLQTLYTGSKMTHYRGYSVRLNSLDKKFYAYPTVDEIFTRDRIVANSGPEIKQAIDNLSD